MTPRGFHLQYASQRSDHLVGLADILAGAPAGRPGIVFTPVGSSTGLRERYERTRPNGEAFLDPSGYLIDRDASAQRARHFPWLDASYGRPTDTGGWKTWMELSLEHQTTADGLRGSADNPTITVAPCPWLTAVSVPSDLYRVIDAATALRADSDHDFWLSISVDRDFMRQEVHLTSLADALVDVRPPGLLFRCFHNDLAPIRDRGVLEGTKELIEACAATGIPVFLPNSGWTGWLAMAWGAEGFAGGLSKSSWYDRWPAGMGRVQRQDKIFEAQVLRHVTWAAHTDLVSEPGYSPCWCASCAAMGGNFDGNEAELHQIRVAQEMAATLSALPLPDRRQLVRERLDGAITFRDDLGVPLAHRVDAGFLDTWRSLV